MEGGIDQVHFLLVPVLTLPLVLGVDRPGTPRQLLRAEDGQNTSSPVGF